MENCFGMHGWKEFHRNRKNILEEYRRIHELTTNRPVQTAHGLGVEAFIRTWLSEFLPKKWHVTSGYIIPTLFESNYKLLHYDVIIYDALNAPILWTEGNNDNSAQGKYQAIPAKHIAAVLEIKSRFNKKNIDDMANKLSETNCYSHQFPENFFTSGIFVELKEQDNKKIKILKATHAFAKVDNFKEALILEFEADSAISGLISNHKVDGIESGDRKFDCIAKPIDALNILMTEDGNVKIAENGGGVSAVATSKNAWSMTKLFNSIHKQDENVTIITWSRSGFSNYCMNLICYLDGLTIDDKNRPSFGTIFDTFKREPCEHQPENKVEGSPFISVSPGKLASGLEFNVVTVGKEVEVSFGVTITNEGDSEAEVSDDHFKTSVLLASGKAAHKICKVSFRPKNKKASTKTILQEIKSNDFYIPFRLSYFQTSGEKVFYELQKRVRISKNKLIFS